MFCPHCGTSNAGGQFCTSCGSAIIQPAAAPAPPTPQFVNPSQPTQVSVYATTGASTSNVFSTWGIVLGSVAFLILPVLFGPVGIILAAVGKSKNEPRSTVALAVSIVGTVMGMIIGWIVGSTFGY